MHVEKYIPARKATGLIDTKGNGVRPTEGDYDSNNLILKSAIFRPVHSFLRTVCRIG